MRFFPYGLIIDDFYLNFDATFSRKKRNSYCIRVYNCCVLHWTTVIINFFPIKIYMNITCMVAGKVRFMFNRELLLEQHNQKCREIRTMSSTNGDIYLDHVYFKSIFWQTLYRWLIWVSGPCILRWQSVLSIGLFRQQTDSEWQSRRWCWCQIHLCSLIFMKIKFFTVASDQWVNIPTVRN